MKIKSKKAKIYPPSQKTKKLSIKCQTKTKTCTKKKIINLKKQLMNKKKKKSSKIIPTSILLQQT